MESLSLKDCPLMETKGMARADKEIEKGVEKIFCEEERDRIQYFSFCFVRAPPLVINGGIFSNFLIFD